MTDSQTPDDLNSRTLPKFEPRIPEFLLNKMSPAEQEIFCRLDVNSQQTEHTLRVVLEGRAERKKVVESMSAMQHAHAEHFAQDKVDFGDLRAKHATMSADVTRCATTLDGWKAKLDALGKWLSFFFGRKGVMTGILIAIITYLAVDTFKQHRAGKQTVEAPASNDTAHK